MFRNYITVALRNLRKDKGFSAINIFGLAIGLSTCLLIILFVVDEFSFDRFNEKADRIYRLQASIHVNDNTFNSINTPYPMGPALESDFPEIEKTVRLANSGDMLVKKGNETLMEHHTVYADSSLFDVFTLPMIAGDARTALRDPNGMVISESMATKYFNTTDVLGKTLLTSNTTLYKITGVIRDLPIQSHVHFDFIMAMSGMGESRVAGWLSNNCVTYVLARQGTDRSTVEKEVHETLKKYMEPQIQAYLHSSLEDLEKKGDYFRYNVIPLTQIHLRSNMPDELEPGGDIQYVYIFMIIAVFILLVACVNFMNLSTARSAGRSKEVGVRKVLGSLRTSLITQFLVESVLMSFVALVAAIFLTWLLLPFFNRLSGKVISLNFYASPWLLPSLLAASLFVGLLAGSYPAFYLSAFEPIKVLKGKLATGFKSGWLRNSLVVFQFATAILLIIGTIVIYSQLSYIRNKNLGYDREHVLTLRNTASLWVHAKAFKEEVLALPGVESGTMSGSLPNGGSYNVNGYFKDASIKMNDAILLGDWRVDADFIPTMGMQMAMGRNFSPLQPTDSSCVLINETAAKLLGYSDPINKNIYDASVKYDASPQSKQAFPYRIIGVVRDFHASSLHDKIGPILFHLAENRDYMSFRIRSANIPALIRQIEEKYHSVEKMQGQPFMYSFMDDDFNRLYQSDQRTGTIFISFALFAIIIACLGLFGLVTYAAEQRTKEIGIRKVLGAGIGHIVGLLSKDFLKLVLISMVVAFPIAWWGMTAWLQNFAYRTGLHWWAFAAAGGMAVLITGLTVGFRAVRSALANPERSLRSE